MTFVGMLQPLDVILAWKAYEIFKRKVMGLAHCKLENIIYVLYR